jgi:centromere/kinetochore protein ZW10
LQEKESYVEFLTKEVSFNDQLLSALKGIQGVNERLQQAEELANQQNIIDALIKLEGSKIPGLWLHFADFSDAWTAITDIPLEKSTRAMRLLDTKCFDLRRLIHDQFTRVWNALIRVDFDQSTITINAQLKDGQRTTLDQAIIGLKAYKELEKAANQLWLDLDDAILKPRTNLGLDRRFGPLPAIQIEGVEARTSKQHDT